MAATTTANGKYRYDRGFHGAPLSEWVQTSHAALARASGWEYRPLRAGTFGHDNLAVSLAHMFTRLGERAGADVDETAARIHDGWTENYVFWRDHEPWKHSPSYYAPFNPLGDPRRERCAQTAYEDLPPDEKEKDLCIAAHVCDRLARA